MIGYAVFTADYSHCFPVVRAGGFWVALYGQNGIVAPAVIGEDGFDIVQHYQSDGWRVCKVNVSTKRLWSPLMPATCVGLTKRTLGLRCWAWTPRGLYRRLKRKKA